MAKKRKTRKITATPQIRYYTVNGKRRKYKVWKENGKIRRRLVSKKKRKKSGKVGRQSGHGPLQKDGYYKRSDKPGSSRYSKARDVKIHAKHGAAKGRPFEGDTRKVYYKETKAGTVTAISSKKSALKGKKGRTKVGYI